MALGSAAVPIPMINIGSAFEAAANAALNTTLDPPFNPYANNLFFLHGEPYTQLEYFTCAVVAFCLMDRLGT